MGQNAKSGHPLPAALAPAPSTRAYETATPPKLAVSSFALPGQREIERRASRNLTVPGCET
jgi:hypothetical protein